MNWLQKTCGEVRDLELGDSDREWSYDDYTQHKNFHPNSYMSLGHDTSNIILYIVTQDFKLKEIGPAELNSIPYKDRNHGLISPVEDVDNELANGRIEVDTGKGSINLTGMRWSSYRSNNPIKLKVLDIIFNYYPGISFYVWDGDFKKVPLLKYWEILDR